MSTLSERDSLFLEIAVSEKMISAQQAKLCKEFSSAVSENLVKGGFLSTEQVASLQQKVEDKLSSGNKVAVAQVEIYKEDTLDERVVSLARERQLISEEDERNCRKQQKKLYDLGYNPQLSSILYSAKCISQEDLMALYKEVEPNAKVSIVEKSIPFSELSLPTVPKIGTLKRKTRHEEVQQQESIPSETIHMLDKMEEVVSQISAPQIDIASEIAPPQEEEVVEEVQEEVQEPVSENVESVPATTVTTTATTVTIPNFDKVLEYLENIDYKVTKLQQDQKTAMTEALSHEEMEERFDSEDIPDELQRIIKRLRHVSEEEVQVAIRDGVGLDNCYISKMSSSTPIVVKKVNFTNCVIDQIDFTGVKFKNHVDLGNSRFLTKAIFKECHFLKDATFKSCEFLNGADFAKAQFDGKTTYNSSAFRRYVSFNRCNFGKKTVFTRCYFAKGVKFGEVEFTGPASFNDIFIDHRFYMEKCKFKDSSTFSGARFADISDFGRSKFEKETKFIGATFMKWGSFKNCKFSGSANFNTMNVVGDLAFDNSTFESVVNLRAISASRNISLQNIKIGDEGAFKFLDAHIGRLFVSLESLKGHIDSHIQEDYHVARKEYGLLKNNFREINEYDKEDWAYLMEKRMERMEIKVKGPFSALKRFINWLALDVACGYGTKPANIFVTSLAMLVFFALFYFSSGTTEFVPSGELALDHSVKLEQTMSFIDAVQVSFRTFTNASIEGWVPYTDSWLNYVMMFESFFGFFVMTVLVVTFSRKVIR